jgi:hypothetical protein
VPCEALDGAVVKQMMGDMQSIKFATAVAERVRGGAPAVKHADFKGTGGTCNSR